MQAEARAFVERLTQRIYPLLSTFNQARWDLATLGRPEDYTLVERLGADYKRLFTSEPAEWQTIQQLYAERATITDALLHRSIEQLFFLYAAEQAIPAQIDRIAALEAAMNGLYTNFRGMLDGQPVSENQIKTMLQQETDSQRRRKAWEASKTIGAVAQPDLLELIRLRNQGAQALGFRDYYAQMLQLAEIDEAALFALLDDLEVCTREPFRQLKAEIDAQLAARCAVQVEELRPWHYSDPFFQEPPHTGGVDLDGLFADQDIVALATRTFDGIG